MNFLYGNSHVFEHSLEGFYERVAQSVSPEQMSDIREHFDQLSFHPFWVALLDTAFAGITTRAVIAWGEEVGWRGFVLAQLLPTKGFWRASLLIGLFWGIWQVPLIIAADFYPAHPIAGPLVLILISVLLSPLLVFVRLKARTVLASSVAHGTYSAAHGMSIMLLAGASDVVIGTMGLAGVLSLSTALVGLHYYLKTNPIDGDTNAVLAPPKTPQPIKKSGA